MPLTILVVEPEEALRERVRLALQHEGHRVLAFSRAEGAAESVRAGADPALALLTGAPDPGMDRLVAALDEAPSRAQKVWVAPAEQSEIDQLAAARHPRGLLARASLDREALSLAARVWQSRERGRVLAGAPPMLGDSEAMVRMRTMLERIAAGAPSSVLITGESGTGKEIAARRIHALGPRAHGAFVEVDCASIPANLLESELFGHEQGAFTDARRGKLGLLELAQGGTAFLDEIGELDLGLQSKLLRVLDSRRLRRVGGREEIALDAHLIAATNRDLVAEVREGRFRADLYFRLDVVRVELPPVREREGDAWILAQTFLEDSSRRLRRHPLRLAPSLESKFAGYPWPGNVREIRNLMERLALLTPPEEDVLEDVAFPSDRSTSEGILIDFSGGPVPWEAIEHRAIAEALRVAGGNVSEAARLLGLGRGALRYRMSRHGLDGAEQADLDRAA
jgi:two-component system response regulator AtoC